MSLQQQQTDYSEKKSLEVFNKIKELKLEAMQKYSENSPNSSQKKLEETAK